MEETNKRLKTAGQGEMIAVEENTVDNTENHMTENRMIASEEMEMRITSILEKIDHFTELVSEMLESGKTMFKELSSKFEEHLIQIHAHQLEKWQDEIKDLRLIDASNEELNMLLQNTRSHLLQNFDGSF